MQESQDLIKEKTCISSAPAKLVQSNSDKQSEVQIHEYRFSGWANK